MTKAKAKAEEIPKIEEKTEAELNEIIAVIESSSLPPHVKDFITKCITMALWFPDIVARQHTTLRKLRTMLFGKSGKDEEKNRERADAELRDKISKDDVNCPAMTTAIESAVNADNPDSSESVGSAESASSGESVSSSEPAETVDKKPGHGRMASSAYDASCEITLKIIDFAPGDTCPEGCGGKLYSYNPTKPCVLIRIKGQDVAAVNKYTVEQLRCNLCDYLIKAPIPAEVGESKYDNSFKSWLVIQKYFVAVPFYRQEALQKMLGFPLPDSTQWDLVEQVAGSCYAVFDTLKNYAANGHYIHNDDTPLKIQEIIQTQKHNPKGKRHGMFTTGLIAQHEEHQIALFINGPQHAGENLADILKHREETKAPIIQMCDALSCNIAKGVETIVANCLSHGFRKFQEIMGFFPLPCMTIMKLLSKVYDVEAQTKNMSDAERLSCHQQHSAEHMQLLQQYMQALFAEKLVEPNSELGKAMLYMQKHWHKLTRFLTVAGAPLCNNIVERALKIAIRNRKAAFFYRTRYSAGVGGMLTSLIYTCYLANENPHHYLTALQAHSKQAQQNPRAFLPWNYRSTLDTT